MVSECWVSGETSDVLSVNVYDWLWCFTRCLQSAIPHWPRLSLTYTHIYLDIHLDSQLPRFHLPSLPLTYPYLLLQEQRVMRAAGVPIPGTDGNSGRRRLNRRDQCARLNARLVRPVEFTLVTISCQNRLQSIWCCLVHALCSYVAREDISEHYLSLGMGLVTLAEEQIGSIVQALTPSRLLHTLGAAHCTALCHKRAFLSFKTSLRQSILMVVNEPHTRCSVRSHHSLSNPFTHDTVMCRETDMPSLKACLVQPHLNVVVYHHVYPNIPVVENTITENLPSS